MSEVKIDQKRVKEVFEAYPQAKQVIVCQDGTVFTDKNKSFALDHCKRTNQKYATVDRGSEATAEGTRNWKKNVESIDAYAAELNIEFPKEANTKAEKIAFIESELARLGAEEGNDGNTEPAQ